MKPGVIKVRTNPESCQGCRTCEAVCSARHFCAVNPASTGIRIAEKETLGEFSITVCQQCHEMYCAKVCPVNAIARDAFSGSVVVGDDCTGCGSCVEACEIGAITLADMGEGQKAVKCDLCAGVPECVAVCPRNCLSW